MHSAPQSPRKTERQIRGTCMGVKLFCDSGAGLGLSGSVSFCDIDGLRSRRYCSGPLRVAGHDPRPAADNTGRESRCESTAVPEVDRSGAQTLGYTSPGRPATRA